LDEALPASFFRPHVVQVLSRNVFPGLTPGISAPAPPATIAVAGLLPIAKLAASTIIITYFIMILTSL
jgi:hypothetical protein